MLKNYKSKVETIWFQFDYYYGATRNIQKPGEKLIQKRKGKNKTEQFFSPIVAQRELQYYKGLYGLYPL